MTKHTKQLTSELDESILLSDKNAKEYFTKMHLIARSLSGRIDKIPTSIFARDHAEILKADIAMFFEKHRAAIMRLLEDAANKDQ